MYRYYWIFIIFSLLSFACREKPSPVTQGLPRPVRVVQVEALGTITREFTGIVEAQEFSTLAFKIPGSITELNVKTGQHIKKGEVIARIKPFDYQLDYETANANYEAAKSIYERTRRLFDANAVALQNTEIAEADYVRATSALNIARRTLGYTTLTAPFDGFIERLYADNFEEVLAGQAIVRLVNPENIEVHFTLPENSIRLLQIPKKVYVEFDTQRGMLFTSDIKEYVYSSEGSGIPVTLIITDQQFAPYRQNVFPGFSCKVIWEIDNMISDQFIIPASALLTENAKEYVWIVDPVDLTVLRHPVKTIRFNDEALVKEGLSSDDLIVIAGATSLTEGQKVRIEK